MLFINLKEKLRGGRQGEVSQLSLSFNCNWDGNRLLTVRPEGYAGHGDQNADFGWLASNWFQNSLFAALEREPEKVQVALGSLACSPKGGYLPGPAQVI